MLLFPFLWETGKGPLCCVTYGLSQRKVPLLTVLQIIVTGMSFWVLEDPKAGMTYHVRWERGHKCEQLTLVSVRRLSPVPPWPLLVLEDRKLVPD